jgi:hypothetical protein
MRANGSSMRARFSNLVNLPTNPIVNRQDVLDIITTLVRMRVAIRSQPLFRLKTT